jgi:hypothetical protein
MWVAGAENGLVRSVYHVKAGATTRENHAQGAEFTRN